MDHRDAMIAVLTRDPGRTAVLVDFDGSLAPIVDHPDDARPLPDVAAVLGRLVDRFAVVGVVSGRDTEFLATHLPVRDLVLAGLYGTVTERNGARVVDPRVDVHRDAVARAADEADARLPGILVERKQGMSVTLHWRTAPERAAEVRAVAADLAERHGLDAPQRGRMSVELRPPVPIDKGTAVERLVADCTTAMFAGDDAGDLPAFDALDRLTGDGRLATAVRVAVRSSEAPAAVVTRADVVVDGPESLLAFLDALAPLVH
ncbi:MAG TPA: trehalose-phosphatase [Acidimicrobiia bacterium]|nr:trehalose-phosphatase [Acidimicrobiia bacterium]